MTSTLNVWVGSVKQDHNYGPSRHLARCSHQPHPRAVISIGLVPPTRFRSDNNAPKICDLSIRHPYPRSMVRKTRGIWKFLICSTEKARSTKIMLETICQSMCFGQVACYLLVKYVAQYVVQIQEMIHDIAMLLTNDLVSKFTIRENVRCICAYMCFYVVRCSGRVFLRLLSNALLVAHFVLPKCRRNIDVNESNAELVLSHVFLVYPCHYATGHTWTSRMLPIGQDSQGWDRSAGPGYRARSILQDKNGEYLTRTLQCPCPEHTTIHRCSWAHLLDGDGWLPAFFLVQDRKAYCSRRIDVGVEKWRNKFA